MTQTAKKSMHKEQRTSKDAKVSHTLWTSAARTRDAHKYETEVTADLERAFNDSLERSKEELNKKLQAFENVPLTDSANRCVVM